MSDTSGSVEPEPPPELTDIFAGDKVNVNMVHTQIKSSENCSRDTGGVVNYSPPKKTGADMRFQVGGGLGGPDQKLIGGCGYWTQ